MKTKKTIANAIKRNLLWMFLLVVSFSFGQNNYNVQFQDEILNVPENIQSFEWDQMPASSQLGEGYYGWVQFYQTPGQEVQDAFEANDLKLLEYITNHTYLFYFPSNTSVSYLESQGVRSIVPVEGRFKLSEKLKNGIIEDWAIEGDHILVTLIHHDNVNTSYVVGELATKLISVKQRYDDHQVLELSIPNNCLEDLSNQPYVKWVELISAPAVKDDRRGRSLHRASGLDTQGAGRDYTGVGVGVMVRDDGIVGPHIDFQGRISNVLATGSGQTHGDGVAGIMAGAGNLNPSNRGMAAGSDVHVVNYAANFLDGPTQTLLTNGDVQITNSSYSNGCNAGYTTITQTVDQQTIDMPSVLHVFSAGNSNGLSCGYGAGNQWGNITGGHKVGKNVIATANVFFDGSLVGSSSRGPAHDGRIKPDIAANGQNQISTNENNTYFSFGGTSGAAPGIAGISAQLYQVYAEANGGNLPPSALIKAALLNTANDYGNVGPDFKFGWGIVNALRAGMLIEDERYLSDQVSQGASNTHTIAVPAGTTQARFMVYWSDAPAAPGATTALVNDLDLVVTDPSNTDYLPWILDTTPNPTNLDLPATNGADHLNNMEQVLINNPASGNYTIDISGFNVPQGPQEYFVVYEIITENLTVTYPNGGEKFVPNGIESIHWDATNVTGSITLEYSVDGGSSWNNITTVSNSTTNFAWSAPAGNHTAAKIRVSSGSFSDESDDDFSIAQPVTVMDVDQVCPTEATISWPATPGADSYDLYLLGDQYMEFEASTTGTSITFPIADPNESFWYALVAKNSVDGWESRRNNAKFQPGGIDNCLLANDISMVSINNAAGDFSTACGGGTDVVSISLENTGTAAQSGFTVSYQLDGGTPVTETYSSSLAAGATEVYDFTTPLSVPANGGYVLTTSVSLSGDENPFNNDQTLNILAYTDAIFVPIAESFETNGVPPNSWVIENADNSLTWEEKANIVGSDGSQTIAAYVNNYDYQVSGQQDGLLTDLYDLTNLISDGYLSFDLAKAQHSAARSDVLFVAVSTDCGSNFSIMYGLNGLALSTLPTYNTTPNWEPTAASEWRTEEIDISAYAGEQVIFKFINSTDNGNSTFIDNIEIDGILAVSDVDLQNIAMYPNPTSEAVTIEFGANTDRISNITINNSLGQQIGQFGASQINDSKATIDVSNYATGLYFVTIKTESQTTTKKLLVQ